MSLLSPTESPARTPPLSLHEDRLFSSDPSQREIARRLYQAVRELPILSPHGHTEARWFAENRPFADPSTLLIIPDHYLYRMLYSQGVELERLGIPRADGELVEGDSRTIWRLFAEHWPLFRGTPSQLWMNHVLYEVFGVRERLTRASADRIYDRVAECLSQPEFLPRALFERFKIEVLATTESPLDPLTHHQALRASGWRGRVITAYRPDPVVDPEFAGFAENVAELGRLTHEDTTSFHGYLSALRNRREFFASQGATSTDHGHPSASTANLSRAKCQELLSAALSGSATAEQAELFRAQMLTEMASMSVEDGMVMQLHPGVLRNHNPKLFRDFGRDRGADIPITTEYVKALKPLLDRFGNDRRLSLIVFTVDDSSYARELAPLAGHYPALKLGPAWWFHDSPEGMRAYRKHVTETAGFYNTVGFNDDTRAFLSIPARHDVARRMDCAFLAELVADHRLEEDEAVDVALDLTYRLPKAAYKL
jgi:glucuronate isomerase